MSWLLKACPQCGGDMFREDEQHWHCLQCSRSLPTNGGSNRPLARLGSSGGSYSDNRRLMTAGQGVGA